MKRRAFTFAEMIIVMPLVAVLGTCVLMAFLSINAEYAAAVMQGDLKLESRRAVAQLFSCAARGPWRIDADQRGLTFADGSRARWEGQRLTLQGKSLLQHRVGSFLAIRRHNRLIINLELEAPAHIHGPGLHHHFIYDYPNVKEDS